MSAGEYLPACALCDWTGDPSPDQRVAYRRAADHATTHGPQHRAEPAAGTEVYLADSTGPADTLSWNKATCMHCGKPISWDPRNLWDHD
jgi:hypothetical protein